MTARTTTLLAATLLASATVTGCKADTRSATEPFVECVDEPGCQTKVAPVAANVIPALTDATERSSAVLEAKSRGTIALYIARLEAALVDRDITRGRAALTAALDAIGTAERADAASRADLGAIRLGLAPAARSLGLPNSVIEAPLY